MDYRVPRRYRFPANAPATTALVVLLSGIIGAIAVGGVATSLWLGIKVNDLTHRNRASVLIGCNRANRSDGILRELVKVSLLSLSLPARDPKHERIRRQLYARFSSALVELRAWDCTPLPPHISPR